jgi:hypothetical protein
MKTVSLELAKKMKELGFPEESYFEWEIGLDGKAYLSERVPEHYADEPRYFPAPTAEEVLEQLPGFISPKEEHVEEDNAGYLDISKFDDIKVYSVTYVWRHSESDKSLAEAAGKMFCYLKENKLI